MGVPAEEAHFGRFGQGGKIVEKDESGGKRAVGGHDGFESG